MKKLIICVLSVLCFTGCKEQKTNVAGEKMQAFVIDIAQYAKGLNPNFIIIPQNGAELAFNHLSPEEGTNAAYLAAIDGIGVEELFYNGAYAPDNERISMLQQLKNNKKIMVSEFVNENVNVADAIQRNRNEGFICFPRTKDNYHYKEIPDTATQANADNITSLSQAKNYLYLINSENYTSKSAMIQAIASTNFDVILIDLFYNGEAFTPAEIQQLKTKATGAKRLVIAYLNIGSAENFRYYWQNDWKLNNPKWIKKKYDGYEDEFWVEFWNEDWQKIIYGNEDSYMKKVIQAGFDGAYLDNVEAYYFLYHN